jgi:hypothetical protein
MTAAILRKELQERLSQNFSFWNSYLRFNGKTAVRRFFQELGTKLTEFWDKLRIISPKYRNTDLLC